MRRRDRTHATAAAGGTAGRLALPLRAEGVHLLHTSCPPLSDACGHCSGADTARRTATVAPSEFTGPARTHSASSQSLSVQHDTSSTPLLPLPTLCQSREIFCNLSISLPSPHQRSRDCPATCTCPISSWPAHPPHPPCQTALCTSDPPVHSSIDCRTPSTARQQTCCRR